jgi:hypothetical protein
MATEILVNGVAELKCGTGTGGALELLGHSVDGVTRDPQIIEEPIFSDAGGGPGGVPVAHQRFGEIHIISADMLVIDKSVLGKIRKGGVALVGSVTEGVMTKAGTVLDNSQVGGSGKGGYYRLLILSPDGGEPWNYLYARLVRMPVRLSTRPSIYRLQWECIPYVGTGDTMAGVVLFNNVTT